MSQNNPRNSPSRTSQQRSSQDNRRASDNRGRQAESRDGRRDRSDDRRGRRSNRDSSDSESESDYDDRRRDDDRRRGDRGARRSREQRDDRNRRNRDERSDSRNTDVIFVVAGPVDTTPTYVHTHDAHFGHGHGHDHGYGYGGWGGHGHGGWGGHGHGWGGHGHGWGGHGGWGGYGHGHGGGYWNVETGPPDETFREVVQGSVFDKQCKDPLDEDDVGRWLSLALAPDVYTNDSTAICSSILMQLVDTLPVSGPAPTSGVQELSTTTTLEMRSTAVESTSESAPEDDGIRVIFPSGNVPPSPEAAESTFIFEQLADCNPLYGKTALSSTITENPSTFILDSQHAAGEGNNASAIQDSQSTSKTGADIPSEPVIVCAKKSQTTVRGSLDEEYQPYSKLKAPASQESGSVVEEKQGYLAISENLPNEMSEDFLVPTTSTEDGVADHGIPEANNVCNFIFRHLIGTLPLIEERSSDNIPIEPTLIISSHFSSNVDRGTLSEKHVLSRPSDADKVCTNIMADLVTVIPEQETCLSSTLSAQSFQRSVKRMNEDKIACPLEQKSLDDCQIAHDNQTPQDSEESSGSEYHTNSLAYGNKIGNNNERTDNNDNNERTSFITYTAMQECPTTTTNRTYGHRDAQKGPQGYTNAYRMEGPINLLENTIPDFDHSTVKKEKLLGLIDVPDQLDTQDKLFADPCDNQYTDSQESDEHCNVPSLQESNGQNETEDRNSVLDFLEMSQCTSQVEYHDGHESIAVEPIPTPLMNEVDINENFISPQAGTSNISMIQYIQASSPLEVDINENFVSPQGGTSNVSPIQYIQASSPLERRGTHAAIESKSVCSEITGNIVENIPECEIMIETAAPSLPFSRTIEKISEEASLEFSRSSTPKAMNTLRLLHTTSGAPPKPEVLTESPHEHLDFQPEKIQPEKIQSNPVSVVNSEMIQQSVEYTDKLDVLVESLTMVKTVIREEQASTDVSGSATPTRKPRSCAMINRKFVRRRKKRRSEGGGGMSSGSEDSDSSGWEESLHGPYQSAEITIDSPGFAHRAPATTTHRMRVPETAPGTPSVSVSINVSVPGGPIYAPPLVTVPIPSQPEGLHPRPPPMPRPPVSRKPPDNT